MKVEYQYDYMSRRVERKVWICTAGGANPTWQAAGYGWERFVYDEWNVVMVLNGSDNTAVKKYTWGLDLSGTLHGAGGIGGLLASDENGSGSGCTGKFWFFYDANGNVGQIFKYVPSPESVTLAAYYEYDPYGGILDSGGSGAYPSQNPVRFSTKWFDVDFETGLGYWGYRYYSPRLGRWISRDPIGEKGGVNLYAFVQNSAVNGLDPVGEACTISFNCTLVKSTPQGPCNQACDYSCTEKSRQDSMTGQTSCDDIPKPANCTLTTTADGDWLCKATRGLLGKKGVCPGTETTTHVLYETAAKCRNCSRAACRAGCDQVYKAANMACSKLKGPARVICGAAAEVAHRTCIDGCNAYCQNP